MLKNRTYLPSGKRTPRPGTNGVAKKGALKSGSSRIELPDTVRGLPPKVPGVRDNASSIVTDAAENRTNAATFLILAFIVVAEHRERRKYCGNAAVNDVTPDSAICFYGGSFLPSFFFGIFRAKFPKSLENSKKIRQI